MQAIGAWLADVLNVVCNGYSPLENFLHPLGVAVGANMAYAVLARTGNFQGARLRSRCDQLHEEASAKYDLLKDEFPDVMKNVKLDGNKLRCDNHISVSLKRIAQISQWFAFIAVIFGTIAVVLMVIGGIWPDSSLPNWAIVLILVILLAPVPVGLGWTFGVIRSGEANTAEEYRGFFHAINSLNLNMREQTQQAIKGFEKKLSEKRPGIVRRLLIQTDIE